MNEETRICQEIRLALSHGPVRLFLNPVGEGWLSKTKTPGAWYIRYGLAVSSADLVGIKSVVVTPEMVGKTIGIAVSIEVKTPGGSTARKRKIGQGAWRTMVQRLGGIAGQAQSVEEARKILENKG